MYSIWIISAVRALWADRRKRVFILAAAFITVLMILQLLFYWGAFYLISNVDLLKKLRNPGRDIPVRTLSEEETAGNNYGKGSLEMDEQFGLGLVALSGNEEEEALAYFSLSNSTNSRAVIERVRRLETAYHPPIDLDDPTLWGFFGYIEMLAQNPRYPFFKIVKKELDDRNPNKELGQLGLFYNARFSPVSNYLVIYCSNKTILLESANGKVREVISLHGPQEPDSARLVFSKDEKKLLRIIALEGREDSQKVITCEDFRQQRVVWNLKLPWRIEAGFSRDGSRCVVLNYRVDSESSDVRVFLLDVQTGKALSEKSFRKATWDGISKLFDRYSADRVDYFPGNPIRLISSPDKRYVLMGNVACGYFILKESGTNRKIREFRFASDVE